MELKISCLGVGHGDAFLIRWKGLENGECWICLIDGGAAPKILHNHLKKLGVDFIDIVVGTHPDSDHIEGLLGLTDICSITSYWAPPIPVFERHLWLFGNRCQDAINRSRTIEDTFKAFGTEILYPVEGYNSAPFGTSGPRIHILSPAARLIKKLLTTDDVSWLFASEVMPLGWIFSNSEEEDIEPTADVVMLNRALATGVLRPSDIAGIFRRELPANTEEKNLAKDWSEKTGIAPEFFGDSVLNNTSIVCWLEIPSGYNTNRILLPGDQENWTYLLARHPRGLNADVLKAPHHCGRLYLEHQEAYTEIFSHIRPKVLLISANGCHGLPRSSVRDAAIRMGAAILCTSERTQDIIIGQESKETCCYNAMACDGNVNHNTELIFDCFGIRSNRRLCHPGLGTLPSPIIEIRQHIINPSSILDRLAEHELRHHIDWVRKQLRKMHTQRQDSAALMEIGSEPVNDTQLVALAPKAYRTIFNAHLSTILYKGWERGAFWAKSDGSYRNARWSCYTNPTDNEIKQYLSKLSEKVMILFPDAVDKVNRDKDSLVARLETCGLAGFGDATLHYPSLTFVDTLWPPTMKALKSSGWHCYNKKNDVAFSRCANQKELLIALSIAWLKETDSWNSNRSYNFDLDRSRFPYAAAVLISGKSGSRYEEKPLDTWKSTELLKERWLPKATRFYETKLRNFITLAKQIGAHLQCEIEWGSNKSYSFSTISWEFEKVNEAKWPRELVSAIEENKKLTFTIQAPYIAKFVKYDAGLIESTWLKDEQIECLW